MQPRLEVDADEEEAAVPVAVVKLAPWPKGPFAQLCAVADQIAVSPRGLTREEIVSRFSSRGPWKRLMPQLLRVLVALGRIREAGTIYSAPAPKV